MSGVLPKNLAAAPELKGQPEDQKFPVLGALVWYSLRDVRINRADLSGLFTKYNLNPHNLPPEIREPDAFRRATSDIGQRTSKPLSDGTSQVIMVREVATTNDEIVRHIIREVRDSKNKRLSYDQIGSFIFRRDINDFHATASPEYQEIVTKAQELYREYKEFYTGSHIRNMVHNMVHATTPAVVRQGGGVYFVSKEYQGLIDGLGGMVKALNPYGVPGTLEAEFESIPVIDTFKQRQLIFEKYSSQCSKSVDDTLQELSEILKTNKEPTKAVKANYVNQMKELKEGITKYEALLEKDLTIARQKSQLLELQVKALLDKVATPIPEPVKVAPAVSAGELPNQGAGGVIFEAEQEGDMQAIQNLAEMTQAAK